MKKKDSSTRECPSELIEKVMGMTLDELESNKAEITLTSNLLGGVRIKLVHDKYKMKKDDLPIFYVKELIGLWKNHERIGAPLEQVLKDLFAVKVAFPGARATGIEIKKAGGAEVKTNAPKATPWLK